MLKRKSKKAIMKLNLSEGERLSIRLLPETRIAPQILNGSTTNTSQPYAIRHGYPST